MCFIYFCQALFILPAVIMDLSFVLVKCDSKISSCSFHDNSKMFEDAWGKEINWYDPDNGWNEERRTLFLKDYKLSISQSKIMPAYTEQGFVKMKIPSQLNELINKAKDGANIVTESCVSIRQNCARITEDGTIEVKNNTQVLIIEQSPYYALIEKEILSSLQPILESWSGQKLSQDHVVYGIRRYLRGASLMAHVDRLPTHIISAILQIDQKVDNEWPLTVIDHKGEKDKIYLKKGEMVVYESAKVIHGRQFPLDGDYFENLFIHFTIKKDYKKFQAINDYVWSKEP